MKTFILSLIFTLNCGSYIDYETVVALAIKESSGNPNQVRGGDYGLFQIRRSVLADYNRYAKSSYEVADLLDPIINTRIAIWNLCRRKSVRQTATALGIFHLGGRGYFQALERGGAKKRTVEKYIKRVLDIRALIIIKNNDFIFNRELEKLN